MDLAAIDGPHRLQQVQDVVEVLRSVWPEVAKRAVIDYSEHDEQDPDWRQFKAWARGLRASVIERGYVYPGTHAQFIEHIERLMHFPGFEWITKTHRNWLMWPDDVDFEERLTSIEIFGTAPDRHRR